MKTINEKYFINPKQYIPEGIYCSGCPFHDIDETLPVQENGYCHYLKKSDVDINSEGSTIVDMKTGVKTELDYYPFGGLLWDGCKECEVKTYERWCFDCKFQNSCYSSYEEARESVCDEFKPDDFYLDKEKL